MERSFYLKLKDWMSNSVDLDEMAHFEPSHLDLCCLQKPLLSPVAVKEWTKLLANLTLKFLSWNMANTFILFAEKMCVALAMQPGHPPSMAMFLVYPSLDSTKAVSPEAVKGTCNQQRLWSDCTDVHADLCLAGRTIVGFVLCWLYSDDVYQRSHEMHKNTDVVCYNFEWCFKGKALSIKLF